MPEEQDDQKPTNQTQTTDKAEDKPSSSGEAKQETATEDSAHVPLSRFTSVTKKLKETEQALETERAARQAAEAYAETAKAAAARATELEEALTLARAGIVEEEHQVIARALYDRLTGEKPAFTEWAASKPENLTRYLSPAAPAAAEHSSSQSTGQPGIKAANGSAPASTPGKHDTMKAAREALSAAMRTGEPERIEAAKKALDQQLKAAGFATRF